MMKKVRQIVSEALSNMMSQMEDAGIDSEKVGINLIIKMPDGSLVTVATKGDGQGGKN